MKNDFKMALKLYWYFFRVGLYTFGGGWSIVAQIHREFVQKKQLITNEELTDLTTVGRSLPGTMIGNVAFLLGKKLAGTVGGFMAALGMITPSVLILSVVTLFYKSFKDNVYVERALKGVRVCVIPIIADAAIRLWKGSMKDVFCYIVAAAAVALVIFTDIGFVPVILLGAAVGLSRGLIIKRNKKEDKYGTP